MKDYYLTNLVGNPLETTLAAASLVFGGVIERHPRIAFCLSHGGGFVPFQSGRFRHGWRVRGEPKARLKGDPAESLDRLFFDSITHAAGPLRFLLSEVGAERIVFGTDYPFDWATPRRGGDRARSRSRDAARRCCRATSSPAEAGRGLSHGARREPPRPRCPPHRHSGR